MAFPDAVRMANQVGVPVSGGLAVKWQDFPQGAYQWLPQMEQREQVVLFGALRCSEVSVTDQVGRSAM